MGLVGMIRGSGVMLPQNPHRLRVGGKWTRPTIWACVYNVVASIQPTRSNDNDVYFVLLAGTWHGVQTRVVEQLERVRPVCQSMRRGTFFFAEFTFRYDFALQRNQNPSHQNANFTEEPLEQASKFICYPNTKMASRRVSWPAGPVVGIEYTCTHG
jgi:hypothetical protein